MLGMSSGVKLLIVCHCEWQHGTVIRTISACKATKRSSWAIKPEDVYFSFCTQKTLNATISLTKSRVSSLSVNEKLNPTEP